MNVNTSSQFSASFFKNEPTLVSMVFRVLQMMWAWVSLSVIETLSACSSYLLYIMTLFIGLPYMRLCAISVYVCYHLYSEADQDQPSI